MTSDEILDGEKTPGVALGLGPPEVAPAGADREVIDQCVRAVRGVYRDARERGLGKAASLSYVGGVLGIKPRQARGIVFGETTVMSCRRDWPGIRASYARHLDRQAAHLHARAQALLVERDQLLSQADEQDRGAQ
jgi:hypothetical protein